MINILLRQMVRVTGEVATTVYSIDTQKSRLRIQDSFFRCKLFLAEEKKTSYIMCIQNINLVIW